MLEFRFASFDPGTAYAGGYEKINFTLREGELMLVHVVPGSGRTAIADAAQGAIAPTRGEVLFYLLEWSKMSGREKGRSGSYIGRMYEAGSADEPADIEKDIQERAKRHSWRHRRKFGGLEPLMKRIGLDALPKSGEGADPESLRLAQWVRTFAAGPELILLERPMQGVSTERLPALLEEVRLARKREAAVLWITEHVDVWGHPDLMVDQRYAVDGSRLRPVE